MTDTFELFDLRVTVEEIRGACTCAQAVGDSFEVRGGQLSLPPGQGFCLYALQSTIPLLPAKQRALQANDWMSTDTHVVCPDPLCGTLMRIDLHAAGNSPSQRSCPPFFLEQHQQVLTLYRGAGGPPARARSRRAACTTVKSDLWLSDFISHRAGQRGRGPAACGPRAAGWTGPAPAAS